MKAFVIGVGHRVGEMALIMERVAARGVNVLVYGLAVDGRGGISFITGDEPSARAALDEAEIAYREVSILHVRMEDQPGQAAATSRQLAEAGVNIELWLPVDTSRESFTVALGVDDVTTARQVLAGQVTSFSYA